MPRCLVCDYCSEIDGPGRTFTSETIGSTQGYVCSGCTSAIYDDVERDEVLDVGDLEEDSNVIVGPWGRHPSSEDDIPPAA